MNSSAELTIGEVTKQADLQTSALRYYESVGLLPAPKRVNGQRRFDADVLQHLSVIQIAKEAGFSINEIQILLHGFEPDTPPCRGWRVLAVEKLAEVEDSDPPSRGHEAVAAGRYRLRLPEIRGLRNS